MALFEAGNTEIYTRLLEGEYINYRNLLPADCATSVKVETNMLKDSLERASILAREGNNNVVKFETVSYTHLDVYKRQVLNRCREKPRPLRLALKWSAGKRPRGPALFVYSPTITFPLR